MSWKYIMVKVDDGQFPVIFPAALVHADVWKCMRRPFFDMAKLSDPTVVSAGFLEGCAVAVACGESETLKIKSKEGDTRLINNHPYEHGRETSMGEFTEKILLVKTVEMLMARIDEIDAVDSA